MLVARVVASAFDTNCFLVAPDEGEDCVVIDPGIGVEDGVDELIRKHRLNPVAVLLTHGHIDHAFSVVPVCNAKNVPALIHPADRPQLTDPLTWIGMPGSRMFGDLTFAEPDDLRELSDNETVELAGLEFLVRSTPGHTKGSVTFGVSGSDKEGDGPRLFSGDLLFRGSIGRSDFPGGSFQELMDSLARTVLPLPDETVVHTGHYDDTTVGFERRTNPFLAELTGGGGGVSPITRGL